MKLDLSGSEVIAVSTDRLWVALNDPDVLTRCIPGCKSMTETGPDAYKVLLQLRVAAVGGSFEGTIALSDKQPPNVCRITVSGQGTLGNGKGDARFEIVELTPETSRLDYNGVGEIGGLVAGVGQRILGSVSKNLVGRFFVALRKELETAPAEARR
jgi:carbon monoxide dehydrogenase subunit G